MRHPRRRCRSKEREGMIGGDEGAKSWGKTVVNHDGQARRRSGRVLQHSIPRRTSTDAVPHRTAPYRTVSLSLTDQVRDAVARAGEPETVARRVQSRRVLPVCRGRQASIQCISKAKRSKQNPGVSSTEVVDTTLTLPYPPCVDR